MQIDILQGELVAILSVDTLFSVVESREVRIPVPPAGDGPERGFTIRADALGAGELSVDVYLGTKLLGILKFKVGVHRAKRYSEPQSAVVGIYPAHVTPGLMRVVFLSGRTEHFIQLVAGKKWYEAHPMEIEPEELKRELLHITAKLGDLSEGIAPGSLSRKRHELHGIGKKLFKLLPPSFLDDFAEKRAEVRTLAVQGDTQLPWELMADSDGDSFLAEELRISRWLNGYEPASLIRLSNAIFAYSENVAGAEAEIREIGKLLHLGEDPTLVVEPDELYARIEAGDFNLFHFAGHTQDEGSSSAASLLLGNNDAFTLDYMEDVRDESMLQSRPIIFLNACGSASGVGRQTLFDHWAKSFIRRGAGAFIGSLWNIRSATANRFGIEVYRSIKAGEAATLGEAVDLARRRSVRDPSDPTRLAYALYGDDSAQMI